MTTIQLHYGMYANNPSRTRPSRMVPITAETAREWGIPSYDPAVCPWLNLTWVDDVYDVYDGYILLHRLVAREAVCQLRHTG